MIVFHNHPRTGHEPEWFYTLKSLIQDLPVASNADRNELQHHAFNAVGVFRQFFGQGQVLFYLARERPRESLIRFAVCSSHMVHGSGQERSVPVSAA